jgi:hypothetical protein
MVVKGVTADTWTKVGNDWKILHSEDKSQEMTLDGKPFDPSKMAGGGGATTGGSAHSAKKK